MKKAVIGTLAAIGLVCSLFVVLLTVLVAEDEKYDTYDHMGWYDQAFNAKERRAMSFSPNVYKQECDIVIELEENMKQIKSAKAKLQELGESL